MKNKKQPKPEWWEIKEKRKGTGLVPEPVWTREYYLVLHETNPRIPIECKHHTEINKYLSNLIKGDIQYTWMGCGNLTQAQDIKKMIEEKMK